MGSSRAHGPSAGPAEANGLPEAHGLPKVHEPQGYYTPLSVALPFKQVSIPYDSSVNFQLHSIVLTTVVYSRHFMFVV